MRKEIEILQDKRTLLRLRREAILKVLEFNNSIKSVNEEYLKPIILALYFNDSAPMFLTATDAKIYDKDIEVMTSKLINLNKELHFLAKNKQ